MDSVLMGVNDQVRLLYLSKNLTSFAIHSHGAKEQISITQPTVAFKIKTRKWVKVYTEVS